MVNEYKKIVLLNGLEAFKDYEFRLIKSLLAKDLKLTRKMQDDYDRIRIADLMEEKFQSDAGLRKLIAVCKDIPELVDLAETLEKQRLKVERKTKGEKKSTLKKVQHNEPTTAHFMSRTNTDSKRESKEVIPLLKEYEIKKSEDPERMQPPSEQNQFVEPSATSKEQTEGCPQTPHGPPPTPSSSPPIKRLKIEKSVSLVIEQEKISSSLQERQTPRMPPTAPSGRTRTPHLSSREIQTPYLSLTSSSRVKTPHMSPTSSSGRIQTLHFSPMSSREMQSFYLSPTSSNKIQTLHIHPTPSSSLQTPQMPPTEPCNIIQNLQVCPATPSTSLKTPQKTTTSFSSCLLF